MKCGNTPCEREATCYYVVEDLENGHRRGVMHLCDLCRDAFWLGQANSWAVLMDVETDAAVLEEERDALEDDGDEDDDDFDGLTWPKGEGEDE